MYEYEQSSELVLIKRAKDGDTKAFAALYERIYVDLYRFALYTMRHPQDAEDAVSEAVVAAYKNIGKLQKETSFKSWMFTILSNKCKKKFTDQSREDVSLMDEQVQDTLTGEHDFTGNHDLHKALGELTEEERLILLLMVLAGYNSKEVGEMLGINANTVRSKQSRSLEKMRQLLE